MSEIRQRFKVPTFGWILGGLVLVAAFLLLLPSNKQKKIDLARQRLAKEFACPPEVSRLIQEKLVVESRVPKDTSTVIGAPPEPKGQDYESPIRVVSFWNPSKKRPLDSYDMDFPNLGTVGASYPGDLQAQFPGRTVVVAPADNTLDQEVLATALILWISDREKGTYLDNWRMQFRDTKTRPGAIAHIKRALEKEPLESIAEAAKVLKQNRERSKSVPHGSQVYVDASGKTYLVNSGSRYDFESTWYTANSTVGR